MNQEITGHTRLICLLGSPVGHSKSPMMHNEAFRALGLDYAYLAFDVKEEQLEKAIEGLKIFGARGMNLTMPLKNKIVPLCDHLSPAAQLCQAVNTVVIEDDHTLTGHTTDGAGFFMSCRDGDSCSGSFGRGRGNCPFFQEQQSIYPKNHGNRREVKRKNALPHYPVRLSG